MSSLAGFLTFLEVHVDVGFRQTLKVRTLGCARSLFLSPIYALAR